MRLRPVSAGNDWIESTRLAGPEASSQRTEKLNSPQNLNLLMQILNSEFSWGYHNVNDFVGYDGVHDEIGTRTPSAEVCRTSAPVTKGWQDDGMMRGGDEDLRERMAQAATPGSSETTRGDRAPTGVQPGEARCQTNIAWIYYGCKKSAVRCRCRNGRVLTITKKRRNTGRKGRQPMGAAAPLVTQLRQKLNDL
jgi:hypothetical protein